MTWLLIDTAIRAAAAMAVALIGVSILRDARNRLAARLTAGLCVGILAHLLTVSRAWPARPYVWDIPAQALSLAVPPMLWLVAKAVFIDGFRLRAPAVLLVGLYILYGALFTGYIYSIEALRVPGAAALRIGMFAFTIAALVVAWRGRADDLVEDRRRLRDLLIWSIGILTLVIPTMEVMIFANILPRTVVTGAASAILILSMVNAWFLLGLRDDDMLRRAASVPAQGRPVDPDESRMLAALETLMREERLYREDRLSIAGVADRVGVPEYRLRRLVNQRLGHRNFAAYLNGYRLAEVCAALADPAQREVPILTMALDAGFGSLAPFNRAFREAEGMTPTEYRQKALG